MAEHLSKRISNQKFFINQGPFSLGLIASKTNSEIYKDSRKIEIVDLPEDIQVYDIKTLDTAKDSDLSFFTNSKYLSKYENTNALVCITSRKYIDSAPSHTYLLITDNPSLAYAKIVSLFYNTNVIKPCNVGDNFISKSARIGEGTIIAQGAYIGDNVVIGDDCIVHHGATITNAIIGNNTIIHAGTRIGQDGFGYNTDRGRHLRIPQIGRVLIGNDVEIGANCTIDRGSIGDTIISDMCKLDNLIQIGHNVVLGIGCIIVSQTGIAGSTTIGDYVVVGGQVGIAGHLNIGSFTQVAAQSGIMDDLPEKSAVVGFPAQPIKAFFRQVAILKKLSRIGNKDGKNNG